MAGRLLREQLGDENKVTTPSSGECCTHIAEKSTHNAAKKRHITTSSSKFWSRKITSNPQNVTVGMLGPSLLTEANLTLGCPPLQFRSTDYVTSGIPNNCLLRTSTEYTAHWRQSVMVKVCRLCLVKGFPVDFQILLFFGGHLARKHHSCYFLDMQCNFHLSIIALSYDQPSKNSWKQMYKCNQYLQTERILQK